MSQIISSVPYNKEKEKREAKVNEICEKKLQEVIEDSEVEKEIEKRKGSGRATDHWRYHSKNLSINSIVS